MELAHALMNDSKKTFWRYGVIAFLASLACLAALIGIRFHHWRTSGNGTVFEIGGPVIACGAGFESYDRASWSSVPAIAAQRRATWSSFGIRDGNSLGVTLESSRADWHFVLFVPLPF
jgi:hypothetical protein